MAFLIGLAAFILIVTTGVLVIVGIGLLWEKEILQPILILAGIVAVIAILYPVFVGLGRFVMQVVGLEG